MRRGKTYTQVLSVPFHQLCNFVEQRTSFAGVHASPWRSKFKCCFGRFNCFVYVGLSGNDKQRRIYSNQGHDLFTDYIEEKNLYVDGNLCNISCDSLHAVL